MTPLMQQYWDIKSLHTDKILLFRMGDFFEMFFEDAIKASAILGITLTQRNKKSQDETPMCGMPHHSVAGPINKLLANGLKIAICDQVEDPKFAKGIVKRAVTRVLTPGMVYDPDTLDATLSHYLMSCDSQTVAFLEPTTGECFFVENTKRNLTDFLTLPIAEIIISAMDQQLIPENLNITVSLHESLKTDLELESKSALRLLSYVESLSANPCPLRPFEKRVWQSRLQMPALVFRHLEIFESARGTTDGTLFSAVNRTQTSAGARRLREDLRFPLTVPTEIEARYNELDIWRNDLPRLKKTRQILSKMGDLERRLAKIAQPTANPRDLLSLADSLNVADEALEQAIEFQNLKKLAAKIESTLVEEPPLTAKQGSLIRNGISILLDELTELATNSQGMLQAMEEREKAQTQISSLKIRYNNVFGFYIEVTNTHKDKVPSHYKRKQTLTNAERYYTDELIELEKKVLSAETRRIEVEESFFQELKKQILQQASEILALASHCSRLDVTTALAWLAIEQNYVRPQLGHNRIYLKSNRHPVVEQSLRNPFVANTLELISGSCLLLTGPNMAGKSTLMRQVALAVIMAQMGSFVAATEAHLPIFESLHTRIGSNDSLSQGLSTFMVEMTETAEMIKQAGPKSLLILDEIGRGTSTYDGMSLAQAILEYLLKEIKSYTLFATHYHELTSLSQKHEQIQNAHMSVQEKKGDIRFLHTLTPGPAMKSYGIHVAELAGLPKELTKRARELLKQKEISKGGNQLSLLDMGLDQSPQLDFNSDSAFSDEQPNPAGLSLEQQEFIDKIRTFSLENSTPIQALNAISEWKEKLESLSVSN